MHREGVRAGLGGDGVGEVREDRRVGVVARDEVGVGEHLVEHARVDPAVGVERLVHTVGDVATQPVGVEVGQCHADQRHGQLAALDEPVERGEHQLVREVPGDPEQDEDVRGARPAAPDV